MKHKESQKDATCSGCHYFKKGGCPDRNAKAKSEACGSYVERNQPVQPKDTTPVYMGTSEIALENLIEHPAALALPANEDDRACASDAMDAMGYDPLTICKHDIDPDKFFVLDGCGRLKWLRTKGAKTAICNQFMMNGADVDTFCVYRNTMRRKVTTGQRIMAYLALHQVCVLQEAIENSDPHKSGAKRGVDSCEPSYTPKAISDRLHVCKQDVESGIQLLRAMYTAKFPVTKEEDGHKTIVWDEANDKQVASMKISLDNVMKGDTPIRRWRAAASSSASTTGTERSPTDHAKLLLNAMATISRSVVCIHDANRKEQEHFIARWKQLKDEVAKHINQIMS